MKRRARTLMLLTLVASAMSLVACGGGEVGGIVSGLGAARSVTLLNNGSDTLTVTRNGSFFFADRLGANAAYLVSVQTQPVGQTCSLANASGTLDAEATTVDSVRVSCGFAASLRGTVSGLRPGLALTLANGNSQLSLTGDGPFAFADLLADGTAYAVRVLTQPAGLNCIVQNASGSFFAVGFQDIVVVCS